MEFKIAATDLTFEWSNCKACFWAKHRQKWKKPYTPFPSVFSKIDSAMRGYWEGRLASEIDPSLPTVPLQTKAKRLLSKAIAFNVDVEESIEFQHASIEVDGRLQRLNLVALSTATYTQPVSIQVSGSIDMMGQGEVAGLVVDCKTSSGMTPEKAMFYAPQLWVYRHALEHPAKGESIPINHLGLLVMEPFGMASRTNMAVTQKYFPLPTDGLEWFLRDVATVLAGPEPKNDDCPWCKVRYAQD